MAKRAIGIAINGHEIKVAHLIREKNRTIVSFLESATLPAELEESVEQIYKSDNGQTQQAENEEIFNIEKENETSRSTVVSSSTQEGANVLYSLLKKFSGNRSNVGFNVQPALVSYQDLNTTLDYDRSAAKGNLLNKISQWKSGFDEMDNVRVMERSDGTLCNVALETPDSPVVLNLLEQLNSFLKGNLLLSLMTTNEIALANLARKSYHFKEKNEIHLIVQVEEKFSRIIFMRGEDLLTVSPLISEDYTNDINSIIYSKILFELDNLNISSVSTILLCCKAISEDTKAFFEKKFPRSRVGYIISQPLAEYLSQQFSREDLSEYAIPISLAWQCLAESDPTFIKLNLLPKQILDRQRVLKLSVTGYTLFFILWIVTFLFTWQIMSKRASIQMFTRQNMIYEEQIRNNRETVERVHKTERETANLIKSLSLSDSLGNGFDAVLKFLDKANESVLTTESLWIKKIVTSPRGFVIAGNAPSRKSIPILSNTLGETILKKVKRIEYGAREIFEFEMEIVWDNSRFIVDEDKQETESVFVQNDTDSVVEKGRIDPDASEGLVQSEPLHADEVIKKPSLEDRMKGVQEELARRRTSSELATSEIAYIDESSAENYAGEPERASSGIPQNEDKGSIEKINGGADSSLKNTNSRPESERVLKETNQGLTVRISAHAIKFTADKEVELYRNNGIETHIVERNTDVPYWVCYGQYDSYYEAQEQISELKKVIPRNYEIIQMVN